MSRQKFIFKLQNYLYVYYIDYTLQCIVLVLTLTFGNTLITKLCYE